MISYKTKYIDLQNFVEYFKNDLNICVRLTGLRKTIKLYLHLKKRIDFTIYKKMFDFMEIDKNADAMYKKDKFISELIFVESGFDNNTSEDIYLTKFDLKEFKEFLMTIDLQEKRISDDKKEKLIKVKEALVEEIENVDDATIKNLLTNNLDAIVENKLFPKLDSNLVKQLREYREIRKKLETLLEK